MLVFVSVGLAKLPIARASLVKVVLDHSNPGVCPIGIVWSREQTSQGSGPVSKVHRHCDVVQGFSTLSS